MNFIYTLLIRPLELLFEVSYYYIDKLFHHPGISIIGLSLIMNFLVFPLYRRAEKLQEEEKEIEERLSAGVEHIKATFRGNERFYMLQTYYRQNDYKPAYALRGSVPLLLEIPFFVAAYHFLSNLSVLKGTSWGPISDLGLPDGMFHLGSVTIHVLPVLMTIVNLASGMIYAGKMSLKNKVQLVVTALVFLLLLYKAPAGLVFYWLMNNVFSLFKNIFLKLIKHPDDEKTENKVKQKKDTGSRVVFILSALLLTILLGAFVPGSIIASSVSEFVDSSVPRSPGGYIWATTVLAAGFFIIWLGVFFFMADEKGKKRLALAAFCLSAVCVLNCMAYRLRQGSLSGLLQFDRGLTYSMWDYLINGIAVIGIIACLAIYKWNKKLVYVILLSGVCSTGFLSMKNLVNIGQDYKEVVRRISDADEIPTLTFSKTGNNVVVFFVDAMISYYIPYMMEEKPELKEAFDGFTYYPNTVSFGSNTNFASPGLYGGYEYTPKEMNIRDQELLVDKHNEALKVMPVIFSENNYHVTVCDPTYAGYNDTPDLTIYDEYPGIEAYVTMGKFGQSNLSREKVDEVLKRNLFMFSILKISPTVFWRFIYDGGNYCRVRNDTAEDENVFVGDGQFLESLSVGRGIDHSFLKQYYVLENLCSITDVTEGQENHFLMMYNSLPHNPMILKEPEYEPCNEIDNTDYDATARIKRKDDLTEKDFYDPNNYPRYHSNMSAMLKLGRWFDHMKEIGVWDNTKIILVSDHAWRIGDLGGMKKYYGFEVDRNTPLNKNEADFSIFNCTLMVKDFNAGGFTTDNTFMTNADVPALAFQGVVDSPVNPFTGKSIDTSYKHLNKLELHLGANFSVYENNGTKFQPDNWFSVHDNIFDMDNWEYLGVY